MGRLSNSGRSEKPAALRPIQSGASKCQGPVGGEEEKKEKGKKKGARTHAGAHAHEKDKLIEVSISMATQNSFDDVPSQSAGRVWPNHGTDWCSVACY